MRAERQKERRRATVSGKGVGKSGQERREVEIPEWG